MLTYYNEEAKKLGWNQEMKICAEPTCINMAIPSFSYCANHLNKDEKFDSQPFVKTCSAINESGAVCGYCASAATERCMYHSQGK